ncbi:Mce-associated membrane protein [Streptomyces sp. BK208]|uniref:hypothetical protein n=1 Tax=Streptomyces sp. BK208 TaxID=2512150 RepID=UPI00105B88F5|nr:hypothetical protein [Streptomyces sp. BK208]TDT41205.1 Mce-associated membrane protein [Streptomyces sp. BK208]
MTPTWWPRRAGQPEPGTEDEWPRDRETDAGDEPAETRLGTSEAPGASGTPGSTDASGIPDGTDASGTPDGTDAFGTPGDPDASDASGTPDAPGAPDTPSDGPAPRRSTGRLRQAVLAGTAAALVLGGCGFLYAAHQLRSAAPARNQALTDTGATSRVAGDVGNALARVFSYTPDGTAAAERSASTVLDGRAARQYATLFARVRDDLTEQRVTLSTRAVRTGVIELDGDRARLLVFLDQTSHRGESGGKGERTSDGEAEPTTAAAQLTVTARLEADRWRIVDIKAR